jgi:uncharacterized membrane protein YcgQ (UPF0703/DUF1980 family)
MITSQINAANNSVPVSLKEYTQLEIGDTLFDTPKVPKQKLLNSKIFLKGKILKSSLLKGDEIVVYRIIITCCAADGIPLGILVKLPEKMVFHDGEWVGVEGTIQLQRFNEKLKTIEPLTNMVSQEKTAPYFTATKAYKVKAPKDEYLYVQYNY